MVWTPTEPIRLFEAAHKAMGALGRTLIVVDDLQWIDDMSVALLHYLLRAAHMSRQPVALVIASRRSPVATTLAGSLRSVLGASRVRTIELGPLDREAGVRLAREVAPQLDETRAGALWEAASGSPFWLELLATSNDAEADLGRVIADRLGSITTDDAAVLSVLVVAARPVTVDDLAGIQGWPPARVERTAPGLERQGLVQRSFATLTVAHDLIRDAVASILTVEQTRHLHDRIATWLERTGADDVHVLLQALEHRHRAGKPVAVLAARLAAAPGRRVLGTAGFERLAAIADAAVATDPGFDELHSALATLASELGQHDEALRRWSARGIVDADPVEAGAGRAEGLRGRLGTRPPQRARDTWNRRVARPWTIRYSRLKSSPRTRRSASSSSTVLTSLDAAADEAVAAAGH